MSVISIVYIGICLAFSFSSKNHRLEPVVKFISGFLVATWSFGLALSTVEASPAMYLFPLCMLMLASSSFIYAEYNKNQNSGYRFLQVWLTLDSFGCITLFLVVLSFLSPTNDILLVGAALAIATTLFIISQTNLKKVSPFLVPYLLHLFCSLFAYSLYFSTIGVVFTSEDNPVHWSIILIGVGAGLLGMSRTFMVDHLFGKEPGNCETFAPFFYNAGIALIFVSIYVIGR